MYKSISWRVARTGGIKTGTHKRSFLVAFGSWLLIDSDRMVAKTSLCLAALASLTGNALAKVYFEEKFTGAHPLRLPAFYALCCFVFLLVRLRMRRSWRRWLRVPGAVA